MSSLPIPNSFTCFLSLPKELRLAIWQELIPTWTPRKIGWRDSSVRDVTLSRVCRESRDVFMSRFARFHSLEQPAFAQLVDLHNDFFDVDLQVGGIYPPQEGLPHCDAKRMKKVWMRSTRYYFMKGVRRFLDDIYSGNPHIEEICFILVSMSWNNVQMWTDQQRVVILKRFANQVATVWREVSPAMESARKRWEEKGWVGRLPRLLLNIGEVTSRRFCPEGGLTLDELLALPP